jgi:hypothetical protein
MHRPKIDSTTEDVGFEYGELGNNESEHVTIHPMMTSPKQSAIHIALTPTIGAHYYCFTAAIHTDESDQ